MFPHGQRHEAKGHVETTKRVLIRLELRDKVKVVSALDVRNRDIYVVTARVDLMMMQILHMWLS